MLRLHDTAKGQVTELALREPGKVSMYVCGPTVYDVPHIGHGRFTLVWDVLRRYLEWRGYEVRYVCNVTDIEDKIIRKANEDGISTEDVVRKYEKAWWDAMDRLGVRHPDEEPHATAYVEQMVDYVAGLIDRGMAYETSDGIYFETSKLDGYGLLARQSLDSLRAGAGDRVVVGEAEKKSPLDFVLWKKAKPGEPEWPSPWGGGRPGWHIECTVMALDLLGDGFDLHGGGNDLTFPHHENERAQALGAGHAFARYWVHSGMVTAAGGEKMSKSLNNFVSLTDLLERVDGRAYRLLVLQSHYRSPLQVTDDTIERAVSTLERLDAFARRFASAKGGTVNTPDIDRFVERMDDDLDTPAVTAAVFDLVREANAAADSGDEPTAHRAAASVFTITEALGLTLGGDATTLHGISFHTTDAVLISAELQALAGARADARAAKNWVESDRIRDEIRMLGWDVEDTPNGQSLLPPNRRDQ